MPRPIAGTVLAAVAAAALACQRDSAADVTPRVGVPEVAERLTDAFASAAQAVRPSVVRIDVEIERRATAFDFGDLFGPPAPIRGTGSGVILDGSGHVVTNSHVVERASQVTVTLADGGTFEGRVLGTDPLTDVAVVRFAHRPAKLVAARLGSAEALRVGQWVLAVGSPLGLDQSVTAGIVSGLGRTGPRVRLSGERVRRYIQTDAAINPGNSGGPLVNLAGEVVGINTLIDVGPGGAYGFAIPIGQAADVSAMLIKTGRVRYPYLGVRVGDVAQLSQEGRRRLGPGAPAEGALVFEVVEEGPAAQAGVRPGDVITRLGGRRIAGAADLIDLVAAQAIGARLAIELWREGATRRAEATLRELPSSVRRRPSG